MRSSLFAGVMLLVLAAAATLNAVEDDREWQTKMDEKLAKPISINFQDSTLVKALDYFRKAGELNIVLDSRAQDMAEKRLTLRLKGVRVESGIAWTARLMGLDYAVRNEAVFLTKPDDMPVDWRGEMQARYRRMVASGQEAWMTDIEGRLGRTIKVDFRGDQLPAVIEYIATEGGLNIVLDYHLAAIDRPIKLEAEMTVRNVLNWVTRLADIKYVVRDEVIYVASQEALTALRLETGESELSILFRRPVTYHFTEKPLREALDQLSRHAGVTIDLQGLKPDEKLTVTVEGEAVELSRAVRMVMNETGRPYAISLRGTTILIVVSAKGKTGKPAEGEAETKKAE